MEGQITLDGQPLAQGMIRFVPIDGKSQPADATIAGGAYSATAPVGDVRVEITSPKVVGKMKMYDTPDSPSVDRIEEAIPPQYNVESGLKLTVPKGKVKQDFEVKTK